jgi:hypothetical protein
MFGHIIEDELVNSRIDMQKSFNYQNYVIKHTISSLHPHFLIESPIYSFKIDKDGILYIDGEKIDTQAKLTNLILKRKKTLQKLEGLYKHHEMDEPTAPNP